MKKTKLVFRPISMCTEEAWYLEEKGFLTSYFTEAAPVHGGKRKSVYRLTSYAQQVLAELSVMRNAYGKCGGHKCIGTFAYRKFHRDTKASKRTKFSTTPKTCRIL